MLPKQKGFTLIELLVAVTIIAVLSMVGIVIFGGMQIRARDAKRSQDLEALAHALEGKKVAGSIYYLPLASTDFASGLVPDDSKSASQNYCFFGTTNIPPAPPMAQPLATDVNWLNCSGPAADYSAVIRSGVPEDSATVKVTSWTICAKQESTTEGVECKFSKL
ncbi:MAG: type II secretion system protein [Candidatus Daviesbacteria bacterium]